MIIEADDLAAEAVVRSLYTVATGGGRTPLSAADAGGLQGAHRTLLGRDGDLDVGGLTTIEPAEVAAAVRGDARLDLLRAQAVMVLVDAIIEDARFQVLLDTAAAFDLDPGFVRAYRSLLADDVKAAAVDFVRANVDSIPGLDWVPGDPFAAFLPYGDAPDPALEARYQGLADLPNESLGHHFWAHYTGNGFAFPGRPVAVAEAWGTPHDVAHLVSGYDTSPQGESLVSGYVGGQLRNGVEPFLSNVLPSAITYHLGIELNKGINVGDRERMAADPSWRDNFDGNVHLGLDPAKLWVAWDRGRQASVDVFSGHWDFWSLVEVPLDEIRTSWHVPALDPTMAAIPDDQIDPDAFRRPGLPLPQKSDQHLAERPAS